MPLISGSWKLLRKIFTQEILEILRVGKYNLMWKSLWIQGKN